MGFAIAVFGKIDGRKLILAGVRLGQPPDTAVAVYPAPGGSGGRLEAFYAIVAPRDMGEGYRRAVAAAAPSQ
jgi:hypothetical protein